MQKVVNLMKRLLSLILSVCLMLLPISVYAEDVKPVNSEPINEVETKEVFTPETDTQSFSTESDDSWREQAIAKI